MKYGLTFLSILLCIFYAGAQDFIPSNGPRNSSHHYTAFTNAVIHKSADEVISNGTLLIRDNQIVSVSADVEIPANAVVNDLNGAHIYPSFIDLFSNYGMPVAKKAVAKNVGKSKPQYSSLKKGPFSWNENVRPEVNMAEQFNVDSKKAEKMRSMGFGAVLTHQHEGIVRGRGALVGLGLGHEREVLFSENAALNLAFNKGKSKQEYPSSLMGAIALIRQSYYDAIWYKTADDITQDLSLQSLGTYMDLPTIFDAINGQGILRAIKISEEFDRNFIYMATGDAYQYRKEISQHHARLVIPIDFPTPFDASDAYELNRVSLARLKHWELAPANPALLHESGIQFAITGWNITTPAAWKQNLKKVIDYGLPKNELLRSLTEIPAQMIGTENSLGKLEANFAANFFISTRDFFDEKSVILENWISGKKYAVVPNEIDIRGSYNLNVNQNGGHELVIGGDEMKPDAKLKNAMGESTKVKIQRNGHLISLSYQLKGEDWVLLSGYVNDEQSRIWSGRGQQSGQWVEWAAIRKGAHQSKGDEQIDSAKKDIPAMWFPNVSYGFDSLPKQKVFLIKHAIVWTNEDTGIVQDIDVAIMEGKIHAVGKGLSRYGLFGNQEVDFEIIDAKGKHLTTGIIDEHSHIAITGGVNERGQAISAEVQIGDVINERDINLYRQLAGGVTAAQLLHGSANPIGGQSAIIKMRWGSKPEEMKIADADGFIKFALGENVKQSNWGDHHRQRYPQTRMGVEQVFYDAFWRAEEYGQGWTLYNSGQQQSKGRRQSTAVAPRRDLELDAILEILEKKRFITCHSYRQSEINMLMHVADSVGITVNTFTHILEGYKVADKMKKHGAGGSTFSDWWAYKWEVEDATPYNAAVMTEQGVVTAINSDDAEMGRRLNQEAAKTVKYGGLSQEEAWKTVTLNPAKLLHLDDRMGSIAVGKDADLVIWTDNPLSINAQVDKTFIDGKLYYNRELANELVDRNEQERIRIIQKMIQSAKKEKKTQKAMGDAKDLYTCDHD